MGGQDRRAVIAFVMAGALTISAAFFGVKPAGAVELCPVQNHLAELDQADASITYDGAQAAWVLRSMAAPDWADGGHSNATLWLGTDGDILNRWVEVGVTQGWKGTNQYVYYSARQNAGGYQDLKMGLAPVLGRHSSFRVVKDGTDFVARAKDEDTGGFSKIFWSGHAMPVDQYWIGAEYTCPLTSRVDKTYVYQNLFRRASDNEFLTATQGSLFHSGPAGTGVAWCATPITLRVWVHSSIPSTGCN